MYKSEIVKVIGELYLESNGLLRKLLETLASQRPQIDSVSYEIAAASNDAGLRAASAHMNSIGQRISQHLGEISPFAIAIEIHQLSSRFDGAVANYPELEEFLDSGRQSISRLSGAFDLVLRGKSIPALLGLVPPAEELVTEYRNYAVFSALLEGRESSSGIEASTFVELVGGERIEVFSALIRVLSFLAASAESAIRGGEFDSSSGDGIRVSSIESGSPIRIKLSANSKCLSLFLAMLRDVFRVPYLSLTKHGRVVQAMETLALAKTLGIESEEALENLKQSVVGASAQYADSFRATEAKVFVEGVAHGIGADPQHMQGIDAQQDPSRRLGLPGASDE